jgi:AcrR family transcriptional regulator
MTSKRACNHSESVRAALLQAAAAQFLAAGFEATTVRDIAQQAQVTTGSLYHFFGNKEGVFEHLIRGVFATTVQQADQLTASEPDPYTCLSFELAMQIELISADARLAALYHAAHASAPISQLILTLARQRFGHKLAPALPADQLDATAHALAVTAKSLLMGLTQERLITNQLSLDQRLNVLLRGLWGQVFMPTADLGRVLDQVKHLLLTHRPMLMRMQPVA